MKIKKLATLFLTIAMALVFTACGSSGGSGNSEGGGGDLSTLADIYALESEDFMEAYDPEYYACLYKVGDTYTRADADMTQELYDQAAAISYEDEDRDAKVREILGPVEIKETLDVTALLPSDEDVAALKGKTAQELEDEGYELTYVTVFDGASNVNGTKDYVTYLFTFDTAVDENSDTWKEELKDQKVTEAECQGFDFTVLDAGFSLPE